MRRNERFAVRIAVAGMMAGALPAFCAGAPLPCEPRDGEAGIVAEVLDGDTLVLDSGLTVRLAGIAAPKRPLGTADGTDWPSATAATAALRDLALGQPAILRYAGPSRDRYGRARADVVVAPEGRAPISLSDAMILAGMARVMPAASDRACIAPLLKLEGQASKSGLGLWRDPYYAIRAADDPTLAAETGTYDLVEGRVVSVGVRGAFVYLDFGRDWSTDFTAVLIAAVTNDLAARGIAPETLRGRRVRLRGFIESRGGPSLRVTMPELLEIEPVGDPAAVNETR